MVSYQFCNIKTAKIAVIKPIKAKSLSLATYKPSLIKFRYSELFSLFYLLATSG